MIHVQNLTFSYSKFPFIENMNFEVGKGEIFGFLGPSGAGKSTLQKILIGLLTNYTGSVQVNDCETKRKSRDFYEHIGIDFEFPSFYEKFTAAENLNFFASLYQTPCIPTKELLAMVGLLADADKKVSGFSKGMKSRLKFVKSLLHRPDILFLDEPTSGLDPTNSKQMKEIIADCRDKGTTIILTTHNMYDATELCDRVAFIVDGSIKALDTPHNLMLAKKENILEYSYLENGVEMQKQTPLKTVSEDTLLQNLIAENALLTIHSKEPSLEDVFREITGRELK